MTCKMNTVELLDIWAPLVTHFLVQICVIGGDQIAEVLL